MKLKHACRSTGVCKKIYLATTKPKEEVSEPSIDDSNMCEQGQEDDDTGVDVPVKNQTTDQDDSIIDETLNLSTVKDRTRSKSKKYAILTSISL